MRKYKFRCWYHNKMHYDITGFEFYGEGSLSGVFIDGDFADEIELMQFTGLHDKNGKEIYEGDILPFTMIDGRTENYYIVFRDGEYEAINEKDTNFIMIDLWKTSVVIGNIYENSDLLKGVDNIE